MISEVVAWLLLLPLALLNAWIALWALSNALQLLFTSWNRRR